MSRVNVPIVIDGVTYEVTYKGDIITPFRINGFVGDEIRYLAAGVYLAEKNKELLREERAHFVKLRAEAKKVQ